MNQSNNGGQSYFRDSNILRVVNTLYENGPITKKLIVEKTGLSFAKVNSIILSLNASRVALETGREDSNGGRPSALFEINPNYRFIIGCELSHTRVHTIIGNLKGEIITNTIKYFDKSSGKKYVINSIIDSILASLKKAKVPAQKVLGVGVAVAGLVNAQEGSSIPFPHLVDWGDISIKQIIQAEFNLKSYVENVANAAALAEYTFGVCRNNKNLLFLDIGSGIGMGIILNGELYEGTTGMAGEFGHITVDENGPLCECGNVGCIEAIASTKAVVKQAKSLIEKGVRTSLTDLIGNEMNKITFKLVCTTAANGDKLSYNLLDSMGRNLGEGIVTLINLFNPEKIILGNEIDITCPVILDSISNIIQKRALEIPRRSTEIVYSQLGSNAAAIGATIPLIKEFFSTPLENLN